MMRTSIAIMIALAVSAAACGTSEIDLPTSPSASVATPPVSVDQPPSTPTPPSDPTPPANPTPPADPAPTPAPAPPTTPGFTQTLSGTAPAFGEVSHPFTMPRDGMATLTLRWENPTVDLDLSLTALQCTDFLPSSCPLYGITESATGNQEVITRQVKAGETYRMWVVSLDRNSAQPYTLRIDIQ